MSGLWRQQRWGWNLANFYVAFALVDSVRSTILDPEFELASIGALGIVLMFYAVLLWLIDPARVRAEFSPALPENGFLARSFYLPVAQTGLAIFAISLVGTLWGGFVLVVWLCLMFWAWSRRSRGNSEAQSMPLYNKAMKSDVE